MAEEKVYMPPVMLKYYLITDRKQCSSEDDLPKAVKEALKAGFKAVQLREKDLPTIDLYNLALKIRGITSETNALFFVNDRIDIALAVGADGVHLGWQSLPVMKVREMLGPDDWLGVSTHSIEEAIKAEKGGASYITIGPIFTTPSKEGIIKPLGVEPLKILREKLSIPIIAVGGINESNVKEVLKAGANGVAMIRPILTSKDPFFAARKIIENA